MSERERAPGDATRPEPEEIPPESTEFPLETPATSSHDVPQASKTRRRRRLHNQDTQPNKQSFYFVDSNSSSKEKRAHVMRHHVQEKRKQRKASTGSIPVDQMQEYTSWQARKDSGYDTDNRRESVVAGAPGASTEQESSLPIRFSAVTPYSQPLSAQSDTALPGPYASRKGSYSSVMSYYHLEDQELIGYWFKMAYWSGENNYTKNQVYQIASEHLITFQAVVVSYCARFKAYLDGTPETELAQRHVGKARQYIHDATTGVVSLREELLGMALAGMALHEQRFGNKEEARGFLDHALRIMRPRAGCDIPVEAVVHYVQYVLPLPSIPMAIELPAQQWLLSFLLGAEKMMQEHSSPEYQAKTPLRKNAFTMESPLFPLLSSGPRPSEVPLASRMYILPDLNTQEVTRTASLIYITVALWDFADSTDKTGRFLAYLAAIVERHQLDRHPACETLVWLLLEQECDADLRNPERAWSAGELLKTHKQLRPDLQFLFNEIVMSFLMLRAPIRGIDVFQHELRTYTRS